MLFFLDEPFIKKWFLPLENYKKELHQQLLTHLLDYDVKEETILIPTNDALVLFLKNNIELLKMKYQVDDTTAQQILAIDNRIGQEQLASRL